MILTELQTYNLPRLRSLVFKRGLLPAKAKAEKRVKAEARWIRSRSISAIRRQYYLSMAWADLRGAVRRNEDIFITSVMGSAVIGVGAAFMAFELLIKLLNTAYSLSDILHINISLLVFTAFAISAVLYGWIAAFAMNMVSVSIMDGATRKIHRSLRSTARRSLRYASRVAGAWFALAAVVLGPPALAAGAGAVFLHFNPIPMVELLAVMPKAMAVATTWIVFALLQYGLAPHVALFEPEIRLRQVLARSRNLVKRRGRLFMLSVYSVLAAVLVLAYHLAGISEKLFSVDKELSFALAALAAVTTTHGVMVILYRKRKLAKKR